MKAILKAALLALPVLFSASLVQAQTTTQTAATQAAKPLPITGFWQGTLNAGAIPLLFEFAVDEKDGKLQGTFGSLYQTKEKVALSAVSRDGQKVRFEIAAFRAAFNGTLNAQGTQLTGTFEQGAAKLPLTLKYSNKAMEMRRPQQPKPPFPYTSEEVVIPSMVDTGVELAGTLTLPPGKVPAPVVVLITGSGPQDRDESLMGHEPFGVLADYLTRRGIAVLRCDDRGVGKSKGSFATATTADFTNDVRSMLTWLRACPKVNAKHIGLIGHSEGGIIGPLVATKEKDVSFIVMLAGVGVPMKDLLIRQMVDLTRLKSKDPKTIARADKMAHEMITIMTKDMDDATLETTVRAKVKSAYAELTPAERAQAGDPEAVIAQVLSKAHSPWDRWIVRYDPAPTLRAVKCPVLALNGKKDVQVAWQENLAAVARNLSAGGNTHFKTVALPNLNHLFQHCKTGDITEYGQIEETMSPAVLKQVGDWIHAQMK